MDCLLNYDLDELYKLAAETGQPRFRGEQLFRAAHEGRTWDEITNVPKSLKAELTARGFWVTGVEIADKLISSDGTVKYLYRLADGNVIEGVLMKYKYGNTLCVSTQVGCRMNCAFCASGLDGLVRNLTSGEILGQVAAVNRDAGGTLAARAVTNVVLMGSGEPLDNYQEVTAFLRRVNHPKGLNVSERNISLSTSGLADKIYRLADDGFNVTLTVSLHAPDDKTRLSIMPVNKAFDIKTVLDAARYYFGKTGRRVIFEYALIKGVNDSPEQAERLAALAKGFPCHINLIRLNYVRERGLKAADSVKAFTAVLESEGASVTVRRTMGGDIEGACGQLRRRYLSNESKSN